MHVDFKSFVCSLQETTSEKIITEKLGFLFMKIQIMQLPNCRKNTYITTSCCFKSASSDWSYQTMSGWEVKVW